MALTSVLVQPYGFQSPGGGPKILRSLLHPGDDVLSVCTSPAQPPVCEAFHEIHLPSRRGLSALDSTRLAPWREIAVSRTQGQLARRLDESLEQGEVMALHGLAHASDFYPAWEVARRRGLHYAISVHDDLRYALAGHPRRRAVERQFREVWQNADDRMVISTELGEEYTRRYGALPWSVVTDGVDAGGLEYRPAAEPGVYFMGAAHLSYAPNFALLLAVLTQHSQEHDIRKLTCRGSVPVGLEGHPAVAELDWAPDDVVRRELQSAELLYLPLPFDPRNSALSRFSLPTKLISYLASGRPILYHGPANSPAARLLREFSAAVRVHSMDAAELQAGIITARESAAEIVEGALKLLLEHFDLATLRARFRSALLLEDRSTSQGAGS